VLVLLQQHCPHQTGDGSVVGEDPHDPGAALDLLVHALQQVGAPDLAPVGLREVAEGQHILLGLQHELGGPGEALSQRGGQVIPARLDLLSALLGKHAAQGSRDHALVSLGDTLQQVAGKVHPAALPGAALQLPPDRLGEAHVGVADHQLDPAQASLFERDQEFAPEALALAVADLEAQQLTAPVSIDAHGHHHCPGADLQRLAQAAAPSARKVDASPFRPLFTRGLDGAEQCVATARQSRLM